MCRSLGLDIWSPSAQTYLTTRFGTWTGVTEHLWGFADQPSNALVPRVLESMDVSVGADGKTVYTFNIRQGVPFHTQYGDWGDMSAEDVFWIITEHASEGAAASETGRIRRLYFCDGCEFTVTGEYTMELRRPDPTFQLPFMSTYPRGGGLGTFSKKHFEAVGIDQANREPVATGPFMMVEHQTDVLRRNKAVRDHWRKTAEWDEVIWHNITEESTRLANFLTGALDTGTFTTASIDAIKNEDNPDFKIIKSPGGIFHMITLDGQQYNLNHPAHVGADAAVPVSDDASDCSKPWVSCDSDINSDEWAKARKVRLAMNLGIDRQKLVSNLAPDGSPAHRVYGIGWEELENKWGVDQLVFEYDPDRARQLLTEAGYPNGFDAEVFLTGTNSAAADPPAQAAAAMLADIGINITETPFQFSAFRPTLVNRSFNQLHSYGAAAMAGFSPISAIGLFWNANSAINLGFEHPIVQDWIDQAQAEQDADARGEIEMNIIRFFFEEAITIPLFQEFALYPLGPELDDWKRSGTGPQSWLSNWEYAPHR